MALNPPFQLLSLSAEMRLEIYQHLIVDCLAQADPSGLAGLFFSCRAVHQELEAEFGAKMRPLLKAQRRWKKATVPHPEAQRAPLRLKLSRQYFTSQTAPTDLVVILPILQGWLLNSQAWVGASAELKDNPLFKILLACMRPILRLRWAVLTLNLCRIAYAPLISFSLTAKVSEGFFRCLARLKEDLVCNFDQTNRLVLNYGSGPDPVNENHFQTLFHDFQFNWRHSSSPNVMPTPTRGWIARVREGRPEDQGWKLIFDYREGLGKADGALWEIAKEDGLWKGKRQFEGDLDQVVGNHEWEREYDTEGEESVSSSDDQEFDGDSDRNEGGSLSEEDEEVDDEREDDAWQQVPPHLQPV